MLPHDDLVAWVGGHTTALETASWKGKGIYSWSRAKRAMVETLRTTQFRNFHLCAVRSFCPRSAPTADVANARCIRRLDD